MTHSVDWQMLFLVGPCNRNWVTWTTCEKNRPALAIILFVVESCHAVVHIGAQKSPMKEAQFVGKTNDDH